VLEISTSPYNEVVLPPSLDDLREFFRAIPQGEERSTAIWIGALSSTHRMLAKIVQQNIWPVARNSDLILKRAQFVYAIHLRLPFYLCKHILGVILEARDESTAGLPFGCLLTQIILQSGMSCREMTPMMRCPHLLLCQSAFQIWLHPQILCRHLSQRSIMLRLWRLLLHFREG
jgi:hypothetical protein